MTDVHERKRARSQDDLDHAHKSLPRQPPLQTKITKLIQRQKLEDRPPGRPRSESLVSGFTQRIWPKIRNDYSKMTQFLEAELKTVLKGLKIDAEISSRVKDDESIKKTLKRRQNGLLANEGNGFNSYQHIFEEMHDLSGLRIVLKDRDQLNPTRKKIQKLFEQRKLPAYFDPNREVGRFWKKPWFGAYETHNHRVQLSNDNEATVESGHRYSGVMFEIQLTTFSDNLYNKLAHTLLYKADHGLVTEQDEMVIDVSHGLARCFELCMKILRPKLHRDTESRTVGTAEDASEHTEEDVKTAQSVVDRFERDLHDPSNSDRTSQLLRKLLDKNEDAADQACLKDLLASDPRDDKTRIEETKGGLLPGLSNWILEDQDFQRWRENGQNSPFWITGEPGKGKTMMLCGIIDDLSKRSGTNMSYFFCQGTDKHFNTGTAVLRGLIFLLCIQQHSLITHIRVKYDKAGAKLFGDTNTWVSLSKIFGKILGDSGLRQTYLIVDALDECLEDSREELVKLIVKLSRDHPTVKWVVSSRKLEEFNTYLPKAAHLSLGSRRESVSAAVDAYINSKVSELRNKRLSLSEAEEIAIELRKKSEGTFLWVAIVCKELASAQKYELMEILQEMPTGLDQLYGKLVQDIKALKRQNPKYCQSVLRAVAVAFRPLKLDEIQQLADLPRAVPAEIIADMCGSLLTVRKDTAFFVHQSAKDFLSNEWGTVFQSRIQATHESMFSRSVKAMKRSLQEDIYGLERPDMLIESMKRPIPDPLVSIRYSCVYWISHLREARSCSAKNEVDGFLRKHFLHWFEALSLIGNASTGVSGLRDLITLCNKGGGLELLLPIVRDMYRFAQSNMAIIEKAPLQAYSSALIFSPTDSSTRKLFTSKEPEWIIQKPKVEQNWSSCLTTLGDFPSPVYSVAFSPDGHRVICGLDDGTIQIRDAESGAAISTLQGHTQRVWSIAFDKEGKLMTSMSNDLTIKTWDLKQGLCSSKAKGASQPLKPLIFSPDKSHFATCYPTSDEIRINDTRNDDKKLTLRGHSDEVSSVVFSHNGLIASGSFDCTVKIWDAATGREIATLRGHNAQIELLCFSPDSHRIASASFDGTIRIWEVESRAQFSTLQGHHGHRNQVISVDSTLDCRGIARIASGSFDQTVKIWDTEVKEIIQTFKYAFTPMSVAFSPDGRHIVAADPVLHDTLVVSDTESGTEISTWSLSFEGILALSLDGCYIAAGSSHYIKIHAAGDGKCVSKLIGHSDRITCLTFSPKQRKTVASASVDKTIRIWNVETGIEIASLNVGIELRFLKFDATGACLRTRSLVPFRDSTWSSNPTSLQAKIVLPRIRQDGFGVSEDCSWITWHDRNVLWVPPEFRGREDDWLVSFSVLPHMISIGCSSGRVWWVEFSPENHHFLPGGGGVFI